MNALRVIAGAVVCALLGLVLTAGSAVPASAQTFVSPVASLPADLAGDLAAREALKLENYRVMVTAEQLTAAGGGTERGAWSAQKGAMAAADVDRYNIRSTVGLEKGMGQLDTIRPWGVGDKLNANWYNKIPRPTYTGLGFSNPSSLLLLPATAGWEFRGSMADGVLSWAGMSSSDNAVCSQSPDGLGGFTNWLTQADCTMWAAKAEFIANEGIVPGRSLGPVCMNGYCISAPGNGWVDGAYNGAASYCVNETGIANIGNLYVSAFSDSAGLVMAAGGQPAARQIWGGEMCADNAYRYLRGGNQERTAPVKPLTFLQITDQSTGVTSEKVPAVETDTDPMRYRVCDQLGSDGLHYIGTTEGFRESDIASGAPFPNPVCAPLPSGVTSDFLTFKETSPGQPDKILVEQQADATPETDALLGEKSAIYCQTNVCVLDLIIKSSGLTCFSQGESCLGWWDEENHGDTKYQCNYAGHNVAIGECALYSHIFDTQKRFAGNPYSDPVTGEEVGRQTGSSIDGTMMSGLPRASFQGRDCFGAGFGSANPLQWVLRPLQCFGEWAAVPRQSVVQASAIHAQHAWDTTLLGKGPALVSQFGAIPAFTGCEGVPIDIDQTWPIPWGIHWRFGASCDGPLATAAAVSRLVLGGLIGAGGVLAIVTYISGGIGMRRFGRES